MEAGKTYARINISNHNLNLIHCNIVPIIPTYYFIVSLTSVHPAQRSETQYTIIKLINLVCCNIHHLSLLLCCIQPRKKNRKI